MRNAFVPISVALLALPTLADAQLVGLQTSTGCVDLAGSQSRVIVSGRLTLRSFPGPPNYESIASGDAEERVFIVELPHFQCIEDSNLSPDTSELLDTIHVSAAEDVLLAMLRASVGRRVTVGGQGFAAHTAHHRAPLVVLADRISVE